MPRGGAARGGIARARGVANDGGRTDSRRRDDDDIDTRQHFDVRAPAASDAPGGDLSNQLSQSAARSRRADKAFQG